MGVLKAWTGGTWEDISGVTTNEVVTSDTDPRQGQQKNAQIWFDTSTVPPVMKAWNPVTSSWHSLGIGYVAKIGDTMQGNLGFSGANTGVNFNGGSGVYGHTDKPLTLREGTSGGQPQIRDNGGGNARDIIDTVNGDARYLKTAITGTNYSVSWLQGWSGTCQFRVNPASVTLAMSNVTVGNTGVKIFDYPAGVPAPWMTVAASVTQLVPLSLPAMPLGSTVRIEARTDGVYGMADGPASSTITLSLTWSR